MFRSICKCANGANFFCSSPALVGLSQVCLYSCFVG